MSQFSPISFFETQLEAVSWDITAPKPTFAQQLRSFAAQFQMHYAVVHRLGPAGLVLKDTTYVSNLRNLEDSNWTLGDLINKPELEKLFAGNCAVVWLHDSGITNMKQDPLNRLGIRVGLSIPFHNALGNHAALSLFDSQLPHIDIPEMTRFALPLIDAVLTAERSKNQRLTCLSQRETDCLQWAAAGKTSIETGIILGLSPHTVNQYLTVATSKLKAVNRTHAVTKAVQLGLLNLATV
jgi:DNA-binding CsgD family transcriptional regulator